MRNWISKLIGRGGNAGTASRPLQLAFPEELADQVRRVATTMPAYRGDRYPGVIHFVVDGNKLLMPCRIYNREPARARIEELSATEQLILHCIYTRHLDGRVRQRHLRHLLQASEVWVMPFVVALLGEYVVQIHEDIARALAGGRVERDAWEQFTTENRELLLQLRTSYVSYLTAFGWEWSRERPGAQLSGKEAFAAAGVWPNRFARRLSRRAARWHLPPYSPGSTHG